MDEHSELFIGLDTSKLKISVAVAEGERNGEVRFFGDISADPTSVASMVAKLAKRGTILHFAMRQALPGTISIARSRGLDTTARSWHRHLFQGARAIGQN